MEPTLNQPNPIVSLIPLLIIMIPMVFVVNRLAKEKGLNIALWTVLACIPLINFIILPYVIGTPSKTLEDKMDKLLEALKRNDQK